MATQQKIEEKEEEEAWTHPEEPQRTYKNPILYLRKSKKGDHLYAFNIEKYGGEGMVLGDKVGSLLLNVTEVSAVLKGELLWAKVSVLPKEEE